MKATSKVITLILLISFFIGLATLLYPALSKYWNAKVQSRVISDYQEKLDAMAKEENDRLFDEAYDYNMKLAATENQLKDYIQLENYDSLLNLAGNGMMGYVTISKIGIELPVYHTVTADVLSRGVGHIEGTSLPTGGATCHTVLSAHRGLPTAQLFTNLDRLEVGDTFFLTILDRTLTYKVDQITVVTPDDTSEILIAEGKDYCTLLTCTPYGINSHRLLVRGTRIANDPARLPVVEADAYLVDRMIVMPAVALPIIFILTLYVFCTPVKKKPKLEGD